MSLGISPLNINIVLESNPLKSRMLEWRWAVNLRICNIGIESSESKELAPTKAGGVRGHETPGAPAGLPSPLPRRTNHVGRNTVGRFTGTGCTGMLMQVHGLHH